MGDSTDDKEMNLGKLKVADLKRELRLRGLSTSGNKTELMERLQLVIKTDGSLLETDSVVTESELLDDDEVLGGETEEGLDEEFLNKSDDLINSSTVSITDNKRPAPSDEQNESTGQSSVPDKINPPPAKKIVLNRSAAFNVNIQTTNPESKTEEISKPVEMDSEKNLDSKNIVKISSLSAKERLEMRARKFGVAPSEAAKKEMRAARFGNLVLKNSSASSNKPAGSLINIQDTDEKLRKRRERFGQLTKSPTTTTNGATTTTTITTNAVVVPDVDAKKQLRAERFKI